MLRLEVLKDAGAINVLEPRLEIFEDGNKYYQATAHRYYAFLGVLLLAPIGICILIHSAIIHRQEKQGAFLRNWSLTRPGPGSPISGLFSRRTVAVPRLKLPPVRQRIPGLPSIALIAVLTFEIVFIPICLIQVAMLRPHTGLRVRIRRTGITNPRSPGIQPLLVRVVYRGATVRGDLYVGAELMSWQHFPSALTNELKLRPPDWPVYVEGDPDLQWSSVAETIDAIRGLGAEVVLLRHDYGN
ncbi:MAG TPA: hypothetical protein VMH05_01550 [Bryobacteraceae bacterium]|nr:hypothetical protein [Bryobacteraceae bacterium]